MAHRNILTEKSWIYYYIFKFRFLLNLCKTKSKHIWQFIIVMFVKSTQTTIFNYNYIKITYHVGKVLKY